MNMTLTSEMRAMARTWETSKYVVVLTGAGASTEAGLPDWRGPEGMWKQWEPTQLASLSAMRRHPREFYEFYQYRLSKLKDAKPGPTQKALARLQAANKVHRIITQNIDGLHAAAGSKDTVEVHGSLRHAECISCRKEYATSRLENAGKEEQFPRCDDCEGLLKPGIVLFEESLPPRPMQMAYEAAMDADLFIVVGSSLEVGPVNSLPVYAAEAGAKIGIINKTPTHLDFLASWLIREPAGKVLIRIAEQMGIAVEG